MLEQPSPRGVQRQSPGRRNIVLTRNPAWHADGAQAAPSLEAALALLAGAGKAFVIGGGEVYAAALPHADELLLTEIGTVFEGPDAWFPEFASAGFAEVARAEHHSSDGTAFAFVTYRRSR